MILLQGECGSIIWSQLDPSVKISLTFDGYPCKSSFLLVCIDGHYGVVVVNVYLKVMG